jgi:aspartate carbamoyltransferase regulatory subunit
MASNNKQTHHTHIKYILERSCLNKKSFSKEAADKVVDFMATQKKEMYYYKCDFCSSYHLTSHYPDIPKKLEII